MDKAKKLRTPVRTSFTKLLNEMKAELAKPNPNRNELKGLAKLLETAYDKMQGFDNEVIEAMVDANCTDDEVNAEQENIDKYSREWVTINVLLEEQPQPLYRAPSENSVAASTNGARRNFKLPKIELQTFNGDLKGWLGFWSQFQKIDEDESLHNSDKFQYLIQALQPGTEAKEIVSSYPATADNYPKALKALKERFGRESLLLQVYIRELLRLVINNVTQTDKMPFDQMYLKLESHLRALETLNLATADPATWLFPLVESSLPEEILRAWQRSPMSKRDGRTENPPQTCLDILMEFLKAEFQGNQQISLARAGFQNTQIKEKSPRKNAQAKKNKNWAKGEEKVATITGLHVGDKSNCLLCDKPHDTDKCGKATTMTLEEKTEQVKTKKGCLICLKRNHWAKDCKAFVKCLLCLKRHYTVMCPELQIRQVSRAVDSRRKAAQSEPVQNLNAGFAGSTTVFLGTFRARLVNGKDKIEVRALYDPGAQRSYLASRIAEKLNLQVINEERICHSLFGGVHTAAQTFKSFEVKILNRIGGGTTRFSVLEKDKICGPIPKLTAGPWMRELKENKIWVSDMTSEDNSEIELLVGADMFGKLLTGRTHQFEQGFTAIETRLGWVVMGSMETPKSQHITTAMSVINMIVSEASADQLWSLETLGIRDPAESLSKEEREKAVKAHFLSTVSRRDDGRYSVKLPWIDANQIIPSNRKVAESRLISTTAKLHSNDKYFNYNQIFDDWVKEGFIEVVEIEKGEASHFLPHRAVFKPESKTTPVRPVFDASCKTGRNPSLNDCLEKGPNLLEQIPSILLRFRERRIGLTSDIRKAFQMIEVHPDDRKFVNFLWWENSDSKVIKIFRHCRVVFGVNCSPYLLGAVLEYHLESVQDERKPIAQKLLSSLYVDNCVTSVDTIQEYEDFKKTSVELLSEAKMDLRQWEFSAVEESGIGSLTSRECGLGSGSSDSPQELTMVLGYSWNKIEDIIQCNYTVKKDLPDCITKRIILSEVQKIFDPIGFLCPALIPAKLILQQAWAEKTENKVSRNTKTNNGYWDTELSVNLQRQFREYWNQADIFNKIGIPRWIRRNFSKEQIHVFGDASKDAYAAVIFLRVENEEGTSVQLLQAKSRVAPLKKMTIPRLELLACTIAARLTKSVQEALQLDEVPTYFWSDSTTALSWIKRNNEWGTFVGNRVKEICSLTSPESWRHVPGIFNPADLPSRGCTPAELLKSKWWEGPEWLKKTPDQWPVEEEYVNEDEVQLERKKSSAVVLTTLPLELPWYC